MEGLAVQAGKEDDAVMDYVIFASYGNDSVALIRWAFERRLQNVTVAYSDTGWAADWWPARVELALRKAPNVEVQGQDEAQLRTVPLERPVGREG